MKKPIYIFSHLLMIGFLTILTQIGGIAYLFFLIGKKWFSRQKIASKYPRMSALSGFLLIYALISFAVVPQIAKSFGRVPMPVFATYQIPVRPANFLTVLANRHYVKPELKKIVLRSALQMQKKHTRLRLLYLDACFPFYDGFPLLPHLSHDDGRKLDISFLYKNRKTGEKVFGKTPSFLGYGVCEEPLRGEFDQPGLCAEKGHWQYNLLQKLTPDFGLRNLVMHEALTADLIIILTRENKLKKVFIEPHLKKRLGLQNNSKVRFHGCHAVRHDDHIHIEI